jgi:hypothetical protein
MSMLLAHAACPCGISLSLCCMSMMHVHAACTCCLSMAPRLKQREFTSLFSPPILLDTPNPYPLHHCPPHFNYVLTPVE